MVTCQMRIEDGGDVSLVRAFVVLPRIGESILMLVSGQPETFSVTKILHSARGAGVDEHVPSVTLWVAK
jgi:hypothetical protein